MQRFSSFGQKKTRPKFDIERYAATSSRIELDCYSAGNELFCKSYCDVYKIRFGTKQVQY